MHVDSTKEYGFVTVTATAAPIVMTVEVHLPLSSIHSKAVVKSTTVAIVIMQTIYRKREMVILAGLNPLSHASHPLNKLNFRCLYSWAYFIGKMYQRGSREWRG